MHMCRMPAAAPVPCITSCKQIHSYRVRKFALKVCCHGFLVIVAMPGNVSTKKRTSAASTVPPPQPQAGGGVATLKPQLQQPQMLQPQTQQPQTQQQQSQIKTELQAREDDASLPPQRAISAPAASIQFSVAMGLPKSKEISEEFIFPRAPQARVLQISQNPPPRSAQKEFDFKSLAFCLPASMMGQAYNFVAANRAEDEEGAEGSRLDEEERKKVRALPTSSAFMAQSFRFVQRLSCRARSPAPSCSHSGHA
jgi:hypothetical protein